LARRSRARLRTLRQELARRYPEIDDPEELICSGDRRATSGGRPRNARVRRVRLGREGGHGVARARRSRRRRVPPSRR